MKNISIALVCLAAGCGAHTTGSGAKPTKTATAPAPAVSFGPVEDVTPGDPDDKKTPADLPAEYVKESDLPADSLPGLSPAEKYRALVAINKHQCQCGCGLESIAVCRKTDRKCGFAPRYIALAVKYASEGASVDVIEQAIVDSGRNPGGRTQEAEAPRPLLKVANIRADGNFQKGATDADVTIVELADFEDVDTATPEPMLRALLEKYRTARLVWMSFPLSTNPNAAAAARVAEAAGAQGKFWEMHDLLLRHRATLSAAVFETLAQQLKLDMQRFHLDLAAHKHSAKLARDVATGAQVGATFFPAFYINGRFVDGREKIGKLAAIIDDELKKAKALRASGHAGEALYEAQLEANLRAQPPMKTATTAKAAAPAPKQKPKRRAIREGKGSFD